MLGIEFELISLYNTSVLSTVSKRHSLYRKVYIVVDSILIREAKQDDFDFVSTLMKKALSPFYPGNQYARAKNMFASVQGGIDYLAVPMQRVFVAEYAGKSAGFVSVVFNRLNRWSAKVGTLIVAEEYRDELGIGSALLEHAKEFARGAGAAQLYCTVSELNQKTLEFFLRKGFCVAGMAREQYKRGVQEIIICKPLVKTSSCEINVAPFSDWLHGERTYELIVSQAGEAFSGIDERWVDELFAESDLGFRSRRLYVAVRTSEIVGVVGVLPKDGSLVKLEPLVAVSDMALEALLVYLRAGLMGIGRKLYTHIVPKSWQVACLQRNGWRLEGIFPGDYADADAVQQWGFLFTDPLFQ